MLPVASTAMLNTQNQQCGLTMRCGEPRACPFWFAGSAPVRPAQSRAVLRRGLPGTARVFALRRRAPMLPARGRRAWGR